MLKLGIASQLGQFDPDPQFDIVEHGIEPRINALAQPGQLGSHGIKPICPHPADQEVRLHALEQVQQAPAALYGLATAFGEIAHRLQGQDGVEPRRLGDRRGHIHPCRARIASRHEGRTAAGLADCASASHAAGSMIGIYAQGA